VGFDGWPAWLRAKSASSDKKIPVVFRLENINGTIDSGPNNDWIIAKETEEALV
jgi:hypothetical protein